MNRTLEKVINLADEQGIIHSSTLVREGISTVVLSRLVNSGDLNRIGRGLYRESNTQVTEHSMLVDVAAQYNQGFFCLLSALRYYELIAQAPFEIWLGIPHKGRPPKIDYPPLRIIRFTDRYFSIGIETVIIDKAELRITSLTRTIVDCFKFRNKVGLDVALEALNEAWSKKMVNMDELWICATEMRMANIMRPYLESLR
ncbi:MAG: AbiEi antitoxin N-terminal domain-containing protein [Pseudomonadota bacterium]|nr:AbiEi antitoxin N-terminal domain-containing protein [Pseudomonadota bacterium]